MDMFNKFNIEKPVFSTKEFLQSNTLVAKFTFFMIILICFVLFLKLGLYLLGNILNYQSPVLINGMINANNMIVIPQDPNSKNANTIHRSVNERNGIEFTWSVWLYLDNMQYMQGQLKHVFHKGNSNLNTDGSVFPNNAPGLYIAPNTNDLIIMMNTYNVVNEEITIPNIPLNKWINVVLRCKNTTLDVYINNTIAKSVTLSGVPKQNYGDVYVCMNGGFAGYVSNLSYYDHALSINELYNLSNAGPNLAMVGPDTITQTNPNYLSLRWYFAGSQNMYNP